MPPKTALLTQPKQNGLAKERAEAWNERGTLFVENTATKYSTKTKQTLTPNAELKGEPRSGESSERSERL
jgi:hypothetical protein